MQGEAFVPYAGFVSDLKKTFSDDYLPAQHALGVHVKAYEDWDKSDLVALYDSYFGKVVFEYLARLVYQARKESKAYANGSRAHCYAQAELNEFAPANMTWMGFASMMEEAVAEIKSTSLRLTRDIAILFEEPADDAEAPDYSTVASLPTFGTRGMAAAPEAFDQQAALAAMESRTALQQSAPKSSVRDAVASLKNVFTRAAS